MSKFLSNLFCLMLIAVPARAETDAAPLPPETAKKEVLKITDQGLVPKELVLPRGECSVFFLNLLDGADVNLSIQFGSKKMHCHSQNLDFNQDTGEMKTNTPIGSQDFAILCFPQEGTYPFTVTTTSGKKTLGGTVTVQ